MMEKRTIIAFVLSFAVLLLWSYVFAPKEEQVPPKGEPQKEAAAPQSGVPAKPQPAAPVQQPQPKERPTAEESLTAPEKDIVVETPLYVAVFFEHGAGDQELQAKKLYADP